MNISTQNPATARWMLERQAARGVAILDRHVDESPVFESFQVTFRPVALEFLATQAKIRSTDQRDSKELAEANAAVDETVTLVRSWLGPLSRDVTGFESADYTERLTVPEDVINTAEGLLHVVEQVQASDKPLPYGDRVITSLQASIEKAHKELGEAQNAMTETQELRSRARELGVQLHKELVAFRRALRNILGSSHRDYQRLRSPMVSRDDDEEAILEAIASGSDEAPGASPAGSPSPSESTNPSEEVAAE